MKEKKDVEEKLITKIWKINFMIGSYNSLDIYRNKKFNLKLKNYLNMIKISKHQEVG